MSVRKAYECVLNVGLPAFADAAAAATATAEVRVEQIDWQPPARGDAALARRNSMLLSDDRVNQAGGMETHDR